MTLNQHLLPLLLLSSLAWMHQAGATWRQPLDDFLSQHCYECHDDIATKGGLNLLDLEEDLTDAELMRRWVLVHDRVASGEMPPEDEPRPAAPAQSTFLQGLGDSLRRADVRQREVVLRRINRVEYEHTLRDLFELPHLSLKDKLPEDAKAHGFDNIGSALGLSTEQMLVYLDAADHVIDAALGPEEEPETKFRTGNLKKSSQRVLGTLFRDHPDGVVLFSSGYSPSVFRDLQIREPGTYRIRVQARTFQSEEPMILRVYAGDVITSRRDRWLVGHYEIAPGDEWTTIEFEEQLVPYDSIRVITYRNGGHEKEAATTTRPGILIGEGSCEGPLLSAWPPASRTRLLGDVQPEEATEEDAIAILHRLLPHLYRRSVDPSEVEPFARLTQQALAEGRPWMDALRKGIKAMLVSPEFLFLEEPGREQVNDFALASRLSYFLWKTAPDAQLLQAASRGELSRPATLRTQTERLLQDPRSKRFVHDFTGQWLDLHDIDFTEPDKNLFPEYDELLRAGMLEETRRFFAEILHQDLSVGNFLDSDWSILNSRLAEHYGIPGVSGLHYRKVSLPPDSPRGGVLTQASVLKVTANGTNTSPVLRGVWVLENIFGQPAPPPPANVPAVEPDITGATTLREQLDKHRNVESCAGCHRKIDPPGFALERFDPIGGWRDWYRSMGNGDQIRDRFIDPPVNRVRVRYRKGLEVDASGTTPSGEAFSDFPVFKAYLAGHPELIAHTLAEKLLTYGLGRAVGFSDRDLLQEIVARTATSNYGFRTLLHEVIQSSAFRQP